MDVARRLPRGDCVRSSRLVHAVAPGDAGGRGGGCLCVCATL